MSVRRAALVVFLLILLFFCYWIPYLSTTLPSHYRAAHWTAAWVGLDGIEATLAALSLWFLWRRQRGFVVTASMLSGVLLSDAWFDNLTAHGTDVPGARWGLILELGIAAVSILLVVTFRRGV